jgi:predicted amidophosphoribosyltransferase
VLTTGSTISEAIKVLNKAGFKNITGLTIAK